MFETLGLIASVIGIASAIWAIFRFILRPYIERYRSYKNVLDMIKDHFNRWKKVDYSARAHSLIIDYKFLEVNKFRHRLRELDREKLAFLLRCAVQSGIGGEWGDWLVINKENEKIIPALITALDGTAGLRPIWRSAYILEKTFGKGINRLFYQLPPEMKDNESIQFAFKVMSEEGVVEYLTSTSKGTDKDLKRKAQLVIQEIEQFSGQINEYIKSRKRQSLEKLSSVNLYNALKDVD